MTTEYVLAGSKIGSLDDFYDEFGRTVTAQIGLGRNLDAFSDILRGGFGTPEDGFTIRWSESGISRENLGYGETARQLERRLERCHPSNRNRVRQELEEARWETGPTVFEWLVEIIREHGPGGKEAHDNVLLILA